MMPFQCLKLLRCMSPLNSADTLARVPALKSDGLVHSYEYSDAYMDDDRLVIETLRSANESGANLVSYMKASEGLFNSEGKLTGVKCQDLLSGEEHTIKARHCCELCWSLDRRGGTWSFEVLEANHASVKRDSSYGESQKVSIEAGP